MSEDSTLAGKKGPLGSKVPEIVLVFWIIKLLTTGMGEAFSDFLMRLPYTISGVPRRMRPGAIPTGNTTLMVILLVILLVVLIALIIAAMKIQLKSRSYVPWKYWLNVTAVAIVFTAAADFTRPLGLIGSTTLFLVIMAVIFIVWFRSEKTLSIHSITTSRREIFYWASVMATFAMGTALGDLTAQTFELGNLVSGFLFTGLIIVPAVAYKVFHANEIVCFWFAYILTRPLGASFADWMSGDVSRGGLGWGKGPVSLELGVIIVAFVAYQQIMYNKQKRTKNLSLNK